MSGKEVSGVSTLAVAFIEKLKSLCMQPDESINFPTPEWYTWTPGDDGIHMPKYKNILQFRPPAGGNPPEEEKKATPAPQTTPAPKPVIRS